MAKTYRPGALDRTGNTIMSTLVRAGVKVGHTYLLTTTGRRSGQPRTTPVTLVEDETDRWLVAPYGAVGWVHNVRATPEVSLRRGRVTERMRAQEVDAATAGPVLHRYVRIARVTAPYFDASAADDDQRFVDEAAAHPVFRLTPVG